MLTDSFCGRSAVNNLEDELANVEAPARHTLPLATLTAGEESVLRPVVEKAVSEDVVWEDRGRGVVDLGVKASSRSWRSPSCEDERGTVPHSTPPATSCDRR